jgi:hypothetical protein
MRNAILLNADNSLQIIGGVMKIGETGYQCQGLILQIAKGEHKMRPLVGVGINHYVESHTTNGLMREIRSQLTMDEYRVKRLEFIGTKLNIECIDAKG